MKAPRLYPRVVMMAAILSIAFPTVASAAPTLTNVNTIPGGLEGSSSSITYNALKSAANESGDTVHFRLESINEGTLTENGIPVPTNGSGRLSPGETWVWTPADSDAHGNIAAFEIRALDAGLAPSPSDVQVTVAVTPVNDAPSFTSGPNVTVDEDISTSPYSAGWATAISKGPLEGAQTLTFQVSVTSDPVGLFSVAPAISSNGTLTFTQVPHANGTAQISVRLMDDGGTSNGGVDLSQPGPVSFSITINPLNDAPDSSGALTVVNDNASAGVLLFNTLQIIDVDDGPPGAPATEDLTTTVTLDSNDQDLGNFGETTVGFDAASGATVVSTTFNEIVVSGRPGEVTLYLKNNLLFVPNDNRFPVASPADTLNLVLTIEDGKEDGVGTVTKNLSTDFNSINDVPVGSVSSNGLPAYEGQTMTPFANFTVEDLDNGEQIEVAIAITSTVGGTFGNGSLPYTGSPQEVIDFVRGLTFTPDDEGQVDFSLTLTDIHPPSATRETNPLVLTTGMSVSAINRDPSISGITASLIRTGEGQPTAIFSTVSISDLDNDSLTVTVSVPETWGTLTANTGATLFTRLPATPNVYTATGLSPADAGAALRDLLFTPSPSVSGDVLGFILGLDDGRGGTATDSTTQVEVNVIDDSPVISGLPDTSVDPLALSPNAVVTPFGSALVIDDSPVITVTVTLDNNSKGQLASGGVPIDAVEDGGPSLQVRSNPGGLQTGDKVRIEGDGGSLTYNATHTVTAVGAPAGTFKLDVNYAGDGGDRGTWIKVRPLSNYSAGGGGTMIESVDHGLVDGATIEIFDTGNPDFDGTHVIGLIDDDRFTIPVPFTAPPASNGVFTPRFVNTGSSYQFQGSPDDASIALRSLVFVVNETFPFPPTSPGGTTFFLTANDGETFPASDDLRIILQSNRRNHLVTKTTDGPVPADWSPVATYLSGDQVVFEGNVYTRIADGNEATFVLTMWGDTAAAEGTLRLALALAEENDTITFALDTYPATIRLQEKLIARDNISLRGPGGDRLTISGDSDGNLTPDTQLFDIRAVVSMEGLTLDRGIGDNGGAVSVSGNGALIMTNCAITNSIASGWGGAIDVEDGQLSMNGCLLQGNSTDPVLGQGGGAVSLYTSEACSFVNCTFAMNRQLATTGVGGGALYAQAFNPAGGLDVSVKHCTFSENTDDASAGSSIQANGFGALVKVQNSIVADSSGRNLYVQGSALIDSEGGNLSDDLTRATLTQGGVPQSVFLFDQSSDKTSINPLLGNLSMSVGPMSTYPLDFASPAVNSAVTSPIATDGRSVLRNDGSPDSGSFETGAPVRLVLNEVRFSAPAFLEFYNPRDSLPAILNGTELWIDGVMIHTFSGMDPVQPGFGFIVAANGTVDGDMSPVIIPGSLPLTELGVVEIRRPSVAGGGALMSANYNGKFSQETNPTLDYNLAGASITLYPQFTGAAYLPHDQVPNSAGGMSSPGSDTNNTRFGATNAQPKANADQILVGEDEPERLDLLANDFDADGADRIVIVDVSGSTGTGTDDAVAETTEGATVTIEPANNGTPGTPHRGDAVRFDPRGSNSLQSLPSGQERVDTFTYTIVDFTNGTAQSFEDYPAMAGTTLVNSPAHRLQDSGLKIDLVGTGIYDGEQDVILIDLNPPNEEWDKDRFLIDTPFIPGVPASGIWETVEPRPIPAFTERDTATVTITVIGSNDPPTPQDDTVQTPETRVLRIMGDSTLAGTLTSFDTDSDYPAPREISNKSLLLLDTDPDTDDGGESLTVVGVVGGVSAVGEYTQAPGIGAVTVSAPGHGLTDGDTILISGYQGHPSYNAVHAVSIVSSDRFNIPVPFVDNNAGAGVWAPYSPGDQLTAQSEHSADVKLEIRADRSETNIVYNPRPSVFLDGIPEGSSETDTFYYAARDSHGALGLAMVTVTVDGVNDDPVPGNDPATLPALGPILGEALTGDLTTLGDALGNLGVAFLLPSSDGSGDRVSVGLFDPANTGAGTAEVDLLKFTDEETPLLFNIDPANVGENDLLANDSDVDRGDVTTIGTPGATFLSREMASVSISGDGRTLTYNPGVSMKLNALARGERIVDTFVVTVNDSVGSGVSSLVAVLVEGLNDEPVPNDFAPTLTFTAKEDELYTIDSPGVLEDDNEPDRNVSLPDNRRILVPMADQVTGIQGVLYSTGIEAATGSVTGFAEDPGNAALTIVTAPSHPLNAGEEVVILGTGVPAYEGQFVIAAVDEVAGTFTIPLPFESGSAFAVGNWQAVRSSVSYDPRGSLFDHDDPGTFALDGLAVGQSRTDTITYQIFDGSFIFAMDDVFKVAADTAGADLDVLANDRNLTEISTEVNLISVGPTSRGGSALLTTLPNGEKLIRYVPEPNFVGDEVFTYTVEDELGNRDSAQVTVHVTIESLNGNLQANNDAFTVALGQTPLLAVLANDNVIPEGTGSLSITGTPQLPAKGTLEMTGGGIVYTPGAGTSGMDQFSYEISGGGTARAVAVVDIEIVDLENALFTRDDAFSILVGSSENALDVLANDNILPGNGLALTVDFTGLPADLPTNGTLEINASGTGFVYTPASDFVGVDQFRYAVSDGFGSTGRATATVTVGSLVTNGDFFVQPASALDQPLPVLENDQVLASPNGTVTISGVSATAGGAPAPSLTLGTIGSLNLSGGEIQFTAAGPLGEEPFFYTIEDPSGRTAVGMANVAVVADAVSGNPDFFSLLLDSGPVDLDVLFNDVAIPQLPLSLVSIGTGLDAPDQGGSAQVVITPDGPRVRYQPAAGFVGEETFTYTVTDGGRSDTAKVVVGVGRGDLFANDDSYTVFYEVSGDSPRSFTLPALVNDIVLPDAGEILSITGVGIDAGAPNAPSMQGTVVVSEDGTELIYTPAENTTLPAGFSFDEYFTYVISDGTERRAEAQVKVNVRDRQEVRAMETRADAFTVASGSEANILDVLANDGVKPAPASGWSITSVSPPELFPVDPNPADTNDGGVASVSGSTILYSPRAGFVGLVSFTYSVSDGLGGTGSALVTVKVGDVRACSDRFAVLSDSTGNIFDVLANDGVLPDGFPTRPDGSPLSGFTLDESAALTPDQGGTATILDGKIVYQPAGGFNGTERFVYWVKDDSDNRYPGEIIVSVEELGSDRSSGTAQIIVEGVNDPSVIEGSTTYTITDKQTVDPFVEITITDVDNQGAELVSVSVELNDPAMGLLYHPGGLFTRVGDAYVSAPMTPAAATAALRGLTLHPTPDMRVSNGTDEEITLTVSVDDSHDVVNNQGTVVTVKHPPVFKILPVDPVTGADISIAQAAFGVAVSVDGDTMAVGASTRGFQSGPGAVYIYKRIVESGVDRWEQVRIVRPSDGATNDRFGTAIALDGDTLIVGAPYKVTSAGAAYVFERNTGGPENWGETKKILIEPPLYAWFDRFGTDVDIEGNTIVIGAPFAERGGVDCGLVRVYERNEGGAGNWGLLQEIVPTDAVSQDWFGTSVAISGGTMVIGANGVDKDVSNLDHGAAYIFERNGWPAAPWTQTKKLDQFANPLANPGDHFGFAVDISGDNVIVGASLFDSTADAVNAGAAFLFERNTGGFDNWGQLVEMLGTAPVANEQFGYSVAINEKIALAGTNSLSATAPDGFVQCYVRDINTQNWRFTDTLRQPLPNVETRFGYSVAVDRYAAVVGAPWDSDNPSGAITAGAVYSGQLEIPIVDAAHAQFVRDWQIAQFSAATVADQGAASSTWGTGANPDFDPYSNLIELLMGTDPNSADPGDLIKVVPNPGGGFSLRYVRSKDFPAEHVHPAWSTDLRVWMRAAFVETVLADLGTSEVIRIDFVGGAIPPFAYFRIEVDAP